MSLSSFSQKVTAVFSNQSLTQVFISLGNEYHIKFAYDNDKTDNIIIHKSFRNTHVEDLLTTVLSNTGLTFYMLNGAYVLVPVVSNPEIVVKPMPTKKITGIIKDQNSGEHLPYASVILVSSRTGTIANSDGYFTIWTADEDSFLVKISFIGYKDKYIHLKSENKPSLQEILMDVLPREMPTAMVTAKPQEAFELNKQAGSITMNPSKLIDIPSLAEQDIVTPLQLLPGIDGTTESSAGLSIRKAPSDKNMMLYDGMTIYQIDHFFGMISSFNSKAIKDIQIFKSGFDAKYGGRAASVVEITGKSGNMNKPSVDVGVDMWSADAMLEVPIIKNKMSIIITGRRSFMDYYQTPLFRSLFNKTRYDLQNYYAPQTYLTAFKSDNDMPSLSFYDATAKLTYKPTNKDMISISGYKGSDQMNFSKADTMPFLKVKESSNLQNQGISFRWARQWSDRYFHNFLIGVSEYSATINHFDTSSQRSLDLIGFYGLKRTYELSNNIRDFNVNFQNQYNVNSIMSIDFGASVNYYNTNLSYLQEFKGDSSNFKSDDLPVSKSAMLYSPYIQTNFTYGRIKSFTMGLRSNYYSFTKENRLEPRVSLLYTISPKITAKASAGKYHQYVNRLNFQTDYRNIWSMADGKTSPVVTCQQAMVGGTYDVTSSFTIDVEFYYRYMYGLPYGEIIYRKSSLTDSLYNIETTLKVHYTEQTVYGMDVLLKKTVGQYQAWLAYTLSQSSLYSPLLNNNKAFPYSENQLHELKFFNTLRYKNWDFSLSWIFGTGKPWNHYALDYDLNYEKGYSINSRSLLMYHRMDVGVHYNIKIGAANIKGGIDIFNLYNQRNERYALMKLRTNAGLEAVTGGNPLQQVNVYGLGFTPNFFINVRF